MAVQNCLGPSKTKRAYYLMLATLMNVEGMYGVALKRTGHPDEGRRHVSHAISIAEHIQKAGDAHVFPDSNGQIGRATAIFMLSFIGEEK